MLISFTTPEPYESPQELPIKVDVPVEVEQTSFRPFSHALDRGSFMKNLSIAIRMALGFGLLIGITVALGVFAYLKLGAISRHANGIAGDSLPGVYYLGQIQHNAGRTHAFTLRHIQAETKEQRDAILSQMVEIRKENGALYEDYLKYLGAEEKPLFDALKAARANYNVTVDQIIALDDAQKAKEALALEQGKSEELYTVYEMGASEEVNYNKKNADHATKDIVAAVVTAKSGVMAGLLAAAFLAILVAWYITRSVTKPLATTIDFVNQVAHRDLTHDFPRTLLERQDEMGKLGRSMQVMLGSLRSLLREVTTGIHTLSSASTELSSISSQSASNVTATSSRASSVAAAAEEMSANSVSVASGIEQAAANLTSVATATEEMTATIGEIAVNSEKARAITSEAAAQAEHVCVLVTKLSQAANDIGKVTETIANISDQTKLLALNATIEAARAGSAGKGFAVVAHEIKELARQTVDATEDIRARIGGIQSSTAGTLGDLRQITDTIKQVSGIVNSIASAIEEQSVVTKDIARNVSEAVGGVKQANERVAEIATVSKSVARDISLVSNAADEIAEGSKQVLSSSSELSVLAEGLRRTALEFKLSDKPSGSVTPLVHEPAITKLTLGSRANAPATNGASLAHESAQAISA